jgi:biopolymer transport protein ExbB/TolQ
MIERKTKLIIGLVMGILLALGPVWGVIGTVVGMVRAFVTLGQSDPQAGALAGDIGRTLYLTAAGWIACPIGIVLIVVCAIKLGSPVSKAPRA